MSSAIVLSTKRRPCVTDIPDTMHVIRYNTTFRKIKGFY